MRTDRHARWWLVIVAAAALLFMALIVVFGISEGEFRWGF
jgi:hypothetical protein